MPITREECLSWRKARKVELPGPVPHCTLHCTVPTPQDLHRLPLSSRQEDERRRGYTSGAGYAIAHLPQPHPYLPLNTTRLAMTRSVQPLIGRCSGGANTLAEVLIQVLQDLNNVSSGQVQGGYFLIPRAWSQRLEDPSRRRLSVSAQGLISIYDPPRPCDDRTEGGCGRMAAAKLFFLPFPPPESLCARALRHRVSFIRAHAQSVTRQQPLIAFAKSRASKVITL